MMPIVFALAKADFLERSRRYSFLVILILTVYAGYAFAPGPDEKYLTVALGTYRGLYNSAWIGGMMAILTTTFLGLIGFYLVRGSIERDRNTGVGQILASTQLSKLQYLFAKAISNVAVLSAIMVALVGMAAVMQLARGEDRSLNLAALVAPFLFSTLPVLLLVASLAVLFECVPMLRSAIGSVIYFILWNLSLVATIQLGSPKSLLGAMADLTGTAAIVRDMQAAALQHFPNYSGDLNIGIQLLDSPRQMQTFVWHGVGWSGDLIVARVITILCSLAIVVVASLFFDRFEDHAVRRRGTDADDTFSTEAEQAVAVVPAHQAGIVSLPPLTAGADSFRFGAVLKGELSLAVKGLSKWWFIVAVGLAIAQFVAPFEAGRLWLLPVTSVWPLALWSQMGTRERFHETEQLIFSSPHVLARQLPALWLVGVFIALACGFGVAVRGLTAGEWAFLGVWLVGSLFIPTLALALGSLSGSRRLFEALYAMLWYLGPLNHNPYLDYLGATRESAQAGTPVFVAIATVVLLLVALAARRWQMRL